MTIWELGLDVVDMINPNAAGVVEQVIKTKNGGIFYIIFVT